MKVVILHGTYGSPEANWFPWLKAELEKSGHEVYVPWLPTPEGQNVENWCRALNEQCPFVFGGDTILVGHSCGAVYMQSILNMERAEPLAASIFVAGFVGDLGNKEYDELNYSFTHQDFDYDLIRKNAGRITVFMGDNDPYIPRENGEEFARRLGTRPVVVAGGGHLNAESGYTEFPELREKILEEIKDAKSEKERKK
jgi:predicted alpha/beta hydrolase family esterase